jgi:tripartite-type tricarboxylate transporter receptor subunit TctC
MERLAADRLAFVLSVLILGSLGAARCVEAQTYPVKPITMLISQAPGAGTDVGIRVIAQEVSKTLGQEIIPVNKTGGGGAVSAGVLAHSKPDGYTLLATPSPALTSIPLIESVPYDPLKDFSPVIQFGSMTTAVIVRSDAPYKSFRDFVEFARANPGKASIGLIGIGASTHLCLMHVIQKENVNIPIVPFGGATPTVTALLGGHVSACAVSTSGFVSHLKAGKVRVLACTSAKRMENAPEVPTLLDLGYARAAVKDMYVVLAPKGTSVSVVKRLEEVIRRGMDSPGFKAVSENFHMQVAGEPLSGQNLQNTIEDQYNNNKEIMRTVKWTK